MAAMAPALRAHQPSRFCQSTAAVARRRVSGGLFPARTPSLRLGLSQRLGARRSLPEAPTAEAKATCWYCVDDARGDRDPSLLHGWLTQSVGFMGDHLLLAILHLSTSGVVVT
eukprot:6143173-Prymnesium_polylepis.1